MSALFRFLLSTTDIILLDSYLIADYERGNFSISQSLFQSGAQSNIVTIQPKTDAQPAQSPPQTKTSSHSSSIGGGAIAGIVIGVLAVAIIAIFLFWAWKKKRFPFKAPPKIADAENEMDQTITSPAPAYSALDKPKDPAPELEGFVPKLAAQGMDTPLERAEMDVDGTTGRQEMEDSMPAGQELSAPDSQLHEMFDESVYHEMTADHTSGAGGSNASPVNRDKGTRTPLIENEP